MKRTSLGMLGLNDICKRDEAQSLDVVGVERAVRGRCVGIGTILLSRHGRVDALMLRVLRRHWKCAFRVHGACQTVKARGGWLMSRMRDNLNIVWVQAFIGDGLS